MCPDGEHGKLSITMGGKVPPTSLSSTAVVKAIVLGTHYSTTSSK